MGVDYQEHACGVRGAGMAAGVDEVQAVCEVDEVDTPR